MPFVVQEHRDKPDLEIPGDRCFVEYKHIVEEWKNTPRWTTADRLAERLYPDPYDRAYFLAYLVFFMKYVWPYEQKQCEKNGDIL